VGFQEQFFPKYPIKNIFFFLKKKKEKKEEDDLKKDSSKPMAQETSF